MKPSPSPKRRPAKKATAGRRARTLERERHLLVTLMDNIPDRVYFKDLESRFIAVSRSKARRHGREPADLVGLTDFDLFSEKHARKAFEDEQRIIQTGEAVVNVEERETWPDRPDTWTSTTKMPLRDAQGKVIGTFGMSRDITDRKLAEVAQRAAMEAAQASARLKSQFLANMSHEIRTPLNGVIGMTDLLLDTELTKEQRNLANTVRTSGNALLTIINDILDFSKIEAGMLTFEQRPFELREPVEDCLQLMAERAHAKGLELAYLIDDSVPIQVVGDAGRLQQVLLNLVGNAVKFTERGEVVVRVTKEGEENQSVRLRFTVTDTGAGIPPETQQRLFQPFSQEDGSITRKYGGTGLGLAISRQLVELMNGAIGVESEPGRGSTFWFHVKLALQASGLRVIPRKVDLTGQRALIVDDNRTNREILQRQLTAWRVSTACAADGESALALLRRAAQENRSFHFALLDMQMPGMSGFELARRISADPALGGLKMLVLTSMGSMPPFRELNAAGVKACLAKPVPQTELFEAVTALLGGSRPHVVTPAAPARPPPEPKPLRILLAEDNVVNQNVARMQLARLGYMVEIVADGRAAVEAAQAHPFDVMLMDCQMPEMDGYEATRSLRAWEQTRRAAGERFGPLHIIAMTAAAMTGDREACLAAGMDDYISKPVQSSDLAAAITRATDKT